MKRKWLDVQMPAFAKRSFSLQMPMPSGPYLRVSQFDETELEGKNIMPDQWEVFEEMPECRIGEVIMYLTKKNVAYACVRHYDTSD